MKWILCIVFWIVMIYALRAQCDTIESEWQTTYSRCDTPDGDWYYSIWQLDSFSDTPEITFRVFYQRRYDNCIMQRRERIIKCIK